MRKVVLEVNLKNAISPEELMALLERAEAALPAGGPEGVILSGRLPIWVFGGLVHMYHPRPWVATYDPRLQGGVVVQSHVKFPRVGDVIPLENGEKITVEFGF